MGGLEIMLSKCSHHTGKVPISRGCYVTQDDLKLVSLHSQGWHWTPNPSVSTSQMLGLQVWPLLPAWMLGFRGNCQLQSSGHSDLHGCWAVSPKTDKKDPLAGFWGSTEYSRSGATHFKTWLSKAPHSASDSSRNSTFWCPCTLYHAGIRVTVQTGREEKTPGSTQVLVLLQKNALEWIGKHWRDHCKDQLAGSTEFSRGETLSSPSARTPPHHLFSLL